MDRIDNYMYVANVEKIILGHHISDGELEKCRMKYEMIRESSETDQFQFALNLIRSKHKQYIEEGLKLFQYLFNETKDDNIKRDTLYYMSVGEIKQENFEQALCYLNTILRVQKNNQQVINMIEETKLRMRKNALNDLENIAYSISNYITEIFT